MLYFNVNTGEIETIFTPVINGLNDKNEQLILLGKKGIITDGLIQYLIGGKSIGTVATSQGGTVIDGTLVNSPIVNNNNWELNGIDQSVLTNTGIISTDYSIVLKYCPRNNSGNIVKSWCFGNKYRRLYRPFRTL